MVGIRKETAAQIDVFCEVRNRIYPPADFIFSLKIKQWAFAKKFLSSIMIPDETKNKVFSIEKRWVFVAFSHTDLGKHTTPTEKHFGHSNVHHSIFR